MKKKLTELVEDRQTHNSSWKVYHNSLKNDRITGLKKKISEYTKKSE